MHDALLYFPKSIGTMIQMVIQFIKVTYEQLGNLKTCQNGNLILINQVKLYKDKRLQGFCYQALPRKQINFVKHYLLSDLQK